MDYLFDRIEKILARLKTANRIFFFFDYDGTLTPIVSRPEKAVLSKETRALLLALKKSPKFLLAIVSGRSLKDIRELVGLKGVYYVGNHGLEVFAPKRGIKKLVPEKVVPELGRIRDQLNNQLKDVDGVLIEDKGWILAIHYRNVDPRQVPPIFMALKQEIKDSMVPLCLGHGKMVFEIRPQSTVNKGTAVIELLDQVNQDGLLPIYIGDDQTDEDAFQALKKIGMTIFVGLPGRSSAKYYVNEPFEVHHFLKMIENEFRPYPSF
ncbi:MAG: trehalose-phosphatase [Deltaproteobacteria bacterium RBG_19FT_COMBO_46_12]|nr:MAG: trehalose-phosphatase [Deltaproteobacteria bacterium RBG_19FT_COMBO_46_12]